MHRTALNVFQMKEGRTDARTLVRTHKHTHRLHIDLRSAYVVKRVFYKLNYNANILSYLFIFQLKGLTTNTIAGGHTEQLQFKTTEPYNDVTMNKTMTIIV